MQVRLLGWRWRHRLTEVKEGLEGRKGEVKGRVGGGQIEELRGITIRLKKFHIQHEITGGQDKGEYAQ